MTTAAERLLTQEWTKHGPRNGVGALDRPFWHPKPTLVPLPQSWYLWQKPWSPTVAWDRAYGLDFDAAELVRVERAKAWRATFNAAPNGTKLDAVDFYIVPDRLAAGWRALAAEGGVVTRGLSALFNTPQSTLTAIFPKDLHAPEAWQLVRLEGRKRALAQARHPFHPTSRILRSPTRPGSVQGGPIGPRRPRTLPARPLED